MKKSFAIIALAALMSVAVATLADAQSRGHNKSGKAHHSAKRGVKSQARGHSRKHQSQRRSAYRNNNYYRYSNRSKLRLVFPLGTIVARLPVGYVTLGFGANRYYHYNDVYYRSAPGGYVVVNQPENTVSAVGEHLLVYPAAGQSDEQRSRDKYECHEWAVSDSGYNPTAASSNSQLQDNYQRAITACLEARDYVVR